MTKNMQSRKRNEKIRLLQKENEAYRARVDILNRKIAIMAERLQMISFGSYFPFECNAGDDSISRAKRTASMGLAIASKI